MCKRILDISYIETPDHRWIESLKLSVTPGHWMAILGRSGVGKSTLLQLICQLLPLQLETAALKISAQWEPPFEADLQSKVALMSQQHAMLPWGHALDNVLIGARLRGRIQKKDRYRALDFLDQLGLKEKALTPIHQLSGGMQQRVALARVLFEERPIVCLDEPFSALDEHLRTHIVNDMIQSLENFDGSAIFVTHNIEDAYRMCENLMILSNGMIDSFGLKQKIFENPRTLETAKLTNCKNIEEAVRIKKDLIEIPKWRLTLKHHCNVDCNNGFVCIRANNIELYDGISILKDNVFPIWITGKTETPFRQTIYLKFIDDVNNLENHHLEWEISKELWEKIKNIKKQIFIVLPPEKVIYVPRN